MPGIIAIWAWELAAMTSSIVCLVAIVLLLGVFDHKPVFTFHSISLNAIIALLSTLSKTTLLFVLSATVGQWKWILFTKKSRPLMDAYVIDEASRGPLGSLRMVWRMKGSAIACLGAVCTIFALAIDPFTQQLIQYQDLPASQNTTGTTISRAQRFSKGLGPQVHHYFANLTADYMNHTIGMDRFTASTADASIQSAVAYGLTHSRALVTQQLPFACSTGQCSYGTFQSLAVCSKCQDVRNSLVSSYDDKFMLNSLADGGDPMFNGNGTRYALPNGLYINNLDSALYGGRMSVMMTSFGTANTSRTLTLQDVDTLIYSLTMLRWTNDSDSSAQKWSDAAIEALECGLYYCVNEYTPIVVNGTLHEDKQTNATATRSPNSWQYQNETVTGVRWYGPVPESIGYNYYTSLLRRTDLSLGQGFNLSWAAVVSIGNHMQNTLGIPLNISAFHDSVSGYYAGNQTNFSFTPGSSQSLYLSSDLNERFDNIAISLSNALRAESDDAAVQMGMIHFTQIRYSMQWPWVGLHIFLVTLGMIDLLLAIIYTTRNHVQPWKSHLLAAMAWGGQLEDPMVGAVTSATMEKVGEMKMARLYGNVPPDVPKQKYQAVTQSDGWSA